MPQKKAGTDSVNIDTTIETLGESRIASPLVNFNHFTGDKPQPLFLNHEHFDELGEDPIPLYFETAGPREKLYFDTSKSKCAIVTCGGLCPGINDVIRAIVMEAYHAYGVPNVIGFQYGLEGFIPKYKHDVIEMTPDVVSEIHQFGGTMLGSSRGPQSPEDIVDALERMNINALFMIGGDGTMKGCLAIQKEVKKRKLRISIIGVPKTIDNDINFITQSFGFETAVSKATEAIQCAHVEATGVPNGIGLVKLMGRDSGFIAAQASLSLKEVNFVLVPEDPFVLNGEGGLLPALYKRLERRGHAVIVVAEGAGQHLLNQSDSADASGNRVLGDIAGLLKAEIAAFLKEKKMPYSMKYIDPSYIIRSVPASANDRVYCGFLGQHAVHAAMAGKTGMVVARLQDKYIHLPLELVTRKRKKLNICSDYWRAVLESTGQPPLNGKPPK